MGYEKEKQIVTNDNKRILARTLRTHSKQPLDFSITSASGEAFGRVSSVLAELVSSIADRETDYVTIGCSRDGGAILCTVTASNGVKSYAGGTTWERLASELDSLFS